MCLQLRLGTPVHDMQMWPDKNGGTPTLVPLPLVLPLLAPAGHFARVTFAQQILPVKAPRQSEPDTSNVVIGLRHVRQ